MKAQVYTSSSFMIQETNHPHGKLKLAGKFVRRVVMEVGRLFPKKKRMEAGRCI
jgi:hypothetical protein